MKKSNRREPRSGTEPPSMPDSAEWDFRPINEEQLWTALEYEFVRSSTLRGAIDKFHRKPFNCIPFRDQLPQTAFEKLWNDEATIGDAIRAIWDSPLMDDFEGAIDCGTFLNLLSSLLPVAVRQGSGGGIATRYHDLDISFVKLKEELGKKAFDRRLFGLKEPEPGLIWSPHTVHRAVDILMYPIVQRHCFIVNWGFSDTALRKEFKAWLERHRPKKKKSQAGRTSTQERLKQLAAFRLSAAGLSFREAQNELKKRPFQAAHLDVYPLYATQSAWDAAVKKTDGLLKGEFIQKIREAFAERATDSSL